ncbi:dihydroneopterin aldolase [Sphingobium lactosutens]|uniref:dihydroneopterin aldolase n=1 Tax=Sphingobium lactosutens TaxID=522773 RepID=UPI0015BFB0BA|nr:dihydroneopterin aldolase [Sphingobium lactosutens]
MIVAVERVHIEAYIGVHRREHLRRQPLVISVELQVAAASTDELGSTFDYCKVESIARELAEQPRALIETFAQELAWRCLAEGAKGARIVVEKPEALENGMAKVVVEVRQPDLNS